MDLRAGFLFTPGKGLKDPERAAELCEKHISPKVDPKEFLYCFPDPLSANPLKDVNLSQMKSWTEFKGD